MHKSLWRVFVAFQSTDLSAGLLLGSSVHKTLHISSPAQQIWHAPAGGQPPSMPRVVGTLSWRVAISAVPPPAPALVGDSRQVTELV